MPLLVIQLLEVIDVEHEDAQGSAFPHAMAEKFLAERLEAMTIRGPGEAVGAGLRLDEGVLARMFDRYGKMLRDIGGKPHVPVGVDTLTQTVQGKKADAAPFEDQRDAKP